MRTVISTIGDFHIYEAVFATYAGERTFGVLTKLDLMDKGTNALDVRSLSVSFSHIHIQLLARVIRTFSVGML